MKTANTMPVLGHAYENQLLAALAYDRLARNLFLDNTGDPEIHEYPDDSNILAAIFSEAKINKTIVNEVLGKMPSYADWKKAAALANVIDESIDDIAAFAAGYASITKNMDTEALSQFLKNSGMFDTLSIGILTPTNPMLRYWYDNITTGDDPTSLRMAKDMLKYLGLTDKDDSLTTEYIFEHGDHLPISVRVVTDENSGTAPALKSYTPRFKMFYITMQDGADNLRWTTMYDHRAKKLQTMLAILIDPTVDWVLKDLTPDNYPEIAVSVIEAIKTDLIAEIDIKTYPLLWALADEMLGQFNYICSDITSNERYDEDDDGYQYDSDLEDGFLVLIARTPTIPYLNMWERLDYEDPSLDVLAFGESWYTGEEEGWPTEDDDDNDESDDPDDWED